MKNIIITISSFLIMAIISSGCSSTISNINQFYEHNPFNNFTQSKDSNIYKTDVTLKYWVQLNTNVAKTVSNLADSPFGKELTKETGIKVEYIHPPIGQERDNFNIMIASNDLPDIIEYDWYNYYPGGPEKAIKDGVILKLNDIQEKYAPNLTKVYKDFPDLGKAARTDSGSYFQFPAINTSKMDKSTFGAMMRADWLKDLNLQPPTTIDEWYKVIKAFKEQKGAAAPLTFMFFKNSDSNQEFRTGVISGAFNVINGFYLDNGKTVYGPMQPGFKDFLATMNKWYSEGLIDKNFATIDQKTMEATMLSGTAGATFGFAGSTLGKLVSAGQAKNPKYDLVGVPYSAAKKGDTPEFGVAGVPIINVGGVITTKCKNVELAARLLDYGYSEKGHQLFNFGVEGESYKMVNGKPIFTDLIMKNPDKLAPAEALGRYIRASYSGIMVKDEEYTKQYLSMPQQQEALKAWMNSKGESHLIPKISFTAEESIEVAKITNNLSTLNQEMMVKYIMGVEPMSNYDNYVNQIKKLKVDKVLEAYDNAIKRYNSR